RLCRRLVVAALGRDLCGRRRAARPNITARNNDVAAPTQIPHMLAPRFNMSLEKAAESKPAPLGAEPVLPFHPPLIAILLSDCQRADSYMRNAGHRPATNQGLLGEPRLETDASQPARDSRRDSRVWGYDTAVV